METVHLRVLDLKHKKNPLEDPPWARICPNWGTKEITIKEITDSFNNPRLEELGSGTSETWTDRSKPDNEYCNRDRHILRIAWLVTKKDEMPIRMSDMSQLTIFDGWHRLCAAIVRGDETISAVTYLPEYLEQPIPGDPS